MDEKDKEKIRRIAKLTKEEIGKTEEDVKINFIVPLFEALGHKRLKFEHRYKDAFVEIVDPSCKIVIETKNYDKNLDGELQQLEGYCHEERPLLGIIANGSEIRFFSYSWRFRPKFYTTLIYRIGRTDLKDESTIQMLENILSIENLEDGKAKVYVIERENKIESAENNIREIEKISNDKEGIIGIKINELNQKVDEIQTQISHLNVELNNIKSNRNEQISRVWSNLGLPHPVVVEPKILPPKDPSKPEKSYRESYRKQLENPNNLISKINRYIREKGEVKYDELKNVCVSQFGCKSKNSGSIGASVTILENEGYIKFDGRGDAKRLISTKRD